MEEAIQAIIKLIRDLINETKQNNLIWEVTGNEEFRIVSGDFCVVIKRNSPFIPLHGSNDKDIQLLFFKTTGLVWERKMKTILKEEIDDCIQNLFDVVYGQYNNNLISYAIDASTAFTQNISNARKSDQVQEASH